MSSVINLYNQYENSIAVQNAVIGDYKLKLCTAREQKNYCEIAHIQKILRLLTDEKYELLKASVELRKYIS